MGVHRVAVPTVGIALTVAVLLTAGAYGLSITATTISANGLAPLFLTANASTPGLAQSTSRRGELLPWQFRPDTARPT